MAIMTDTPEEGSTVIPSHDYHAIAHVLSGHLQRPIEQRIEPQSLVALEPEGGHLTRFAKQASIEGLISYAHGETRVSGARSLKDNGWVTLSTSILEGLNVFEIITLDRVVSQVSTHHPYENGHEPHVTFLGTQFQNFQVGGFAPTLTLNLGICGDRPTGNQSYFQSAKFLAKVKEQTENIAEASGLPKELKDQYDKKLAYIKQLISTADQAASGQAAGKHEPFTCSVVQNIGKIPIPGVQTFGNLIVIQDFGTVALGEIEVGETLSEKSKKPCVYFELTAVKMQLGCVGHGTVAAGAAKSNGQTAP
jgi:hypothetical protein